MSAPLNKAPRILIAGIGNIFLGDDGFGVEVVQRLARRTLPDGVTVRDFGIRGIDLTYALMDGYDGAILIDVAPRGGTPGTLYVIEPILDESEIIDSQRASFETHGMNPDKVLAVVRALGGNIRALRVIGCEPEATESDSDEMRMGLSEAVRAAVDPASALAISLVSTLISSARETPTSTEIAQARDA